MSTFDPRDRDPAAPPPGVHTPPPGAGLMNALRWGLFALLLVVAAWSIASYVASRRPPAKTTSATQVIYQCPMHPSYTSDKPGECPICGMTLERVERGGGAVAPTEHPGDVPGLATVTIEPERIQLIGVRTTIVRRSTVGGPLELVGFVAPDDSRLKRVQLRVSGWIRHLDISPTGASVMQGYPLFSLYSPELYQNEREYLIALAAGDSMAGMSPDAQAGKERLRSLGIPQEEIDRLEQERTPTATLKLRAPITGAVIDHGLTDGQYVTADTPLFTVADLSSVWVLVDLYEMDIARVALGDRATFTADALPGRVYRSSVDLIYPTVSSDTRTLKVRLSLSNQDGALRPGMFGRVTLTTHGAPALVAPAEAVVNTGKSRYVFLTHAGGRFEPRRVTTGEHVGDDVQIMNGVAEGDTVVSSASFLIDSESRLKAAIQGMSSVPVPGHAHGGTP
jgi:Cu(I)/Ag(I) efflux system membrane fusion protein